VSNRSLIEFNHDFASGFDAGFVEALRRYLKSASRESAEALERYGAKVVGIRHHSMNFVMDGTPDGFPVTYLHPSRAEIAS
jgi:hypothetical protein